MEGSMAGYRIYRVGKEGRFIGVRELHAASDTDAMLQAHKLLDGSDLEVWRGYEKIGYLRADGARSEGLSGLAREGSLSTGNTPEIS
jgi:hypothetical protein